MTKMKEKTTDPRTIKESATTDGMFLINQWTLWNLQNLHTVLDISNSKVEPLSYLKLELLHVRFIILFINSNSFNTINNLLILKFVFWITESKQ